MAVGEVGLIKGEQEKQSSANIRKEKKNSYIGQKKE